MVTDAKMELFEKCIAVTKGKSWLSKVLRDVWAPRMIVWQYIIDVNTILHEICKKGDEKILEEYLYLPGIDINAKNDYGGTALMLASKYGKEQCVEILCKMKDIKINAKNNFGSTALMCASLYGNEKCVEILC